MRRIGPRVAALAAVLCLPAPASAAVPLDVRIERDPRPGALSSELAVNLKVTVVEAATGSEPAGDFEVYAFAEDGAGQRTEIYPCIQEHDNSPEVPRGVYLCAVLVDHGGRWTFQGVVNERRVSAEAPPVTLAQGAAELTVDTDEVAAAADDEDVQANVAEVALLWGHTAAAGLWVAAAGVLSLLALPSARRRLSAVALHHLEERFDVIVKGTLAATGAVIASGMYLLFNLTAYQTPFSSSALDGVFSLPYGKPYFAALALKVGLYGLMLAAVPALVHEARRRLRTETESPPGRFVRVWVGALLAGGIGISVSVTVVKYCHELIEATGALA